jgi:hypothetical protein
VLLLGLGRGMAAGRRDAGDAPVGAKRRRSPRREALVVGGIGVLFFGMGMAIMVHAFHQRVDWAATPMRVDSADVVQRSSDRKVRHYAPRLWIAYEREGHVYHRPVMGGFAWTGSQFAAQQTAQSALHNGPTRAYVDPHDPYRATLDPTSDGSLLLPVVFTLAGLVLLALATRRWRARGPAPATP